jgi:hypothetical protein
MVRPAKQTNSHIDNGNHLALPTCFLGLLRHHGVLVRATIASRGANFLFHRGDNYFHCKRLNSEPRVS